MCSKGWRQSGSTASACEEKQGCGGVARSALCGFARSLATAHERPRADAAWMMMATSCDVLCKTTTAWWAAAQARLAHVLTCGPLASAPGRQAWRVGAGRGRSARGGARVGRPAKANTSAAALSNSSSGIEWAGASSSKAGRRSAGASGGATSRTDFTALGRD